MLKLEFFDIPVYRITREEYYKTKEDYIENEIKKTIIYEDLKENHERRDPLQIWKKAELGP